MSLQRCWVGSPRPRTPVTSGSLRCGCNILSSRKSSCPPQPRYLWSRTRWQGQGEHVAQVPAVRTRWQGQGAHTAQVPAIRTRWQGWWGQGEHATEVPAVSEGRVAGLEFWAQPLPYSQAPPFLDGRGAQTPPLLPAHGLGVGPTHLGKPGGRREPRVSLEEVALW